MKKIALFTCISITTLSAMNDTTQQIISTKSGIQSHGTNINLFKGSPYNYEHCFISVVGKNEQKILTSRLSNISIPNFSCIGDTEFAAFQYPIYIGTKYSQNKRFPLYCSNSCCAFFIEEPCISQQKKVFMYVVKRKSPNGENIIQYHFSHDNAIEEASKDLAMCYTKALTQVLAVSEKTYPKPHTVALPALSTDTGFPWDKAAPIAVNSVVEFTKKNPGKYESINLFVKKHSEFELYKKLLKFYVLWPKLALLYYSPQEHESAFSTLLSELIKYIAKLTIAVTNEI